MNDVISVQLAISKLHLQSLVDQPPTENVAVQALAELNTALVELEAINEELRKQNDALAAITHAHEFEARRYKEFFERVPVPYVITDAWGVIAEANAAAEALFNVSDEMLRGKPISVFVPPAARREFRERLIKQPVSKVFEEVFQPRGRDRIAVQIDVTAIPTNNGETKLGWVVQNMSPQRAAASTERMLERETALRLEAQAAIIRLRALNVGLETMAHDTDMPIRHRVTSLLEALVPRFAQKLTCYLPNEADRPIEVGEPNYCGHVLQTVVLAPNREPGRLIARRDTTFSAEDAAILQSAANGISLLLYST